MPDFEVMPVGTRQAMQETAELLRSYEAHHYAEARKIIQDGSGQGLLPAEIRASDQRRLKAERNGKAAKRLEKLLEQPGVEFVGIDWASDRDVQLAGDEDNGGFMMDEAEGHRRFEAARTAVGFEPPPQDEAFSVPSDSAWQPPSKEPPLDGC